MAGWISAFVFGVAAGQAIGIYSPSLVGQVAILVNAWAPPLLGHAAIARQRPPAGLAARCVLQA